MNTIKTGVYKMDFKTKFFMIIFITYLSYFSIINLINKKQGLKYIEQLNLNVLYGLIH